MKMSDKIITMDRLDEELQEQKEAELVRLREELKGLQQEKEELEKQRDSLIDILPFCTLVEEPSAYKIKILPAKSIKYEDYITIHKNIWVDIEDTKSIVGAISKYVEDRLND